LRGTSQVRFPAAAGVELAGRFYGSGRKAVILSMMGIPAAAQTDWIPLARALERHGGYLVLTYNYRGACNAFVLIDCSRGDFDLTQAQSDLEGAVELMQGQGVSSIALVGADLGATVSLAEAAKPGTDFAGVVSISGIEAAQGYDVGEQVIRAVDEPTLFMVGTGDEDRVSTFRDWTGWARPPTDALTFDSSLRGTFLLSPIAPQDQPIPGRIARAVLDFLDRNA
jgi:predicted alpha/beta hydrolase